MKPSTTFGVWGSGIEDLSQWFSLRRIQHSPNSYLGMFPLILTVSNSDSTRGYCNPDLGLLV